MVAMCFSYQHVSVLSDLSRSYTAHLVLLLPVSALTVYLIEMHQLISAFLFYAYLHYKNYLC